MDITWEKPKPSSSSSHHYRHPSFSSTLLDQIYNSIDQDHHDSTTRTKKQQAREISPRRSIAADYERYRRRSITTTNSVLLRYSNSSSSDSSGFSSSESDSFYKHSRQPKPIRTSVDCKEQKPNNKQEVTGFLRTKSKALKIYTDLKKVKQPISPGGRLATFLNSLLPINPKKPKKVITSTVPEQRSPAISSTTCSSASSFSRSCLSKTPSSSGKSKRSVRFCPVNVILDDEYSSIRMPYGYSNRLYEAKRDREEENRRVIEAAKDLLRTYQKNKDHHHDVNVEDDEDEDDDDDDDALSCASSDLFELENLSAIGIERYREELPVYETTRLDKTNRAIST